MRVIAQGDKLLVKPLEIEKKSRGGIILVNPAHEDREAEAQMFAEVLDVGITAFEWERKHELMFKRTRKLPEPGDVIIMARHAGVRIVLNDEKVRLIQDMEVVAIVEGFNDE